MDKEKSEVWKRDGKECTEEKEEKGRGLPCSCSWFCGDVMPKGAGDDEGEVE